ncbi:recombination regulator RecX [Neobacillus mesonae]|uniref:recombination regulator RecX n=1 Tax=Neobacillus mesonae TaxID=1193713 RepID=UPI002E23FAC3|nr:recombination regulator RecX [Neobacillus mesonae]MED4206552.1 recombination regulator RecX [Neobacillus mesonae]
MAIITKITTQQKNQERYNVFMDYGKGEEFAFSVDSDVLIKFQLKKGMELDEFSLVEIQYQDDIRKAYNSAVQFLARRIRSEKEIKDHLSKKEFEEPAIHEVIHKLKGQKYINDSEFAAAFVRTMANTTDKGPDIIKIELKEKGIAEGIIHAALTEFPKEQQIDKAVKLGEKFFKKPSKDSLKIQKQKLEQQLLRKGYSFEVIQIVLQETVTDDCDEELDAIRYQGEKVHRKYAQYTGFEYEQKMKQALYRKGFSIELIEKYLSEQEKS